MINGKYISLGQILWRIMNNPLMEELDYDEAATHALDALKLIGAPLMYGTIVEKLEVEDYRAYLPENLLKVNGIRKGNQPLRYATNVYHHKNEYDYSDGCDYDLSYTLQNCAITTSFEKGDIEVAYDYIVVDEDGYPMIPDNISVISAVQYHIQYSHIEPYWMMGKIPDKVFERISQQRDWYIGQAQSSAILQGPDHLQSVVNSINRLIINDRAYQNFYKGAGIQEQIKQFR